MLVLGDRETQFRWHGPGLLLPERPCNFLVRMQTREAAFPEHDGYLSLKLVSGGREHYTRDRRTVSVGAGHYFVLNHGQRYSSEVCQEQPLDSLAVFFDPHYASDVLRALTTPIDRLLDHPSGLSQPLRFFDRLYPVDTRTHVLVNRLRRCLADGVCSPEWLSEWFPCSLAHLISAHRRTLPEIEALDLATPASRTELYRRLCWGRDYLESRFDQRIMLSDAAAEACISPYRFLRHFTQAFGVSPHRYLTERRMREARRLLEDGETPVSQVCLDVGYESLGSFSTLFKKHHGVSPLAWRRRNITGE